ncbi:MAG: rhamnan synthesis F family protein [bacterium]
MKSLLIHVHVFYPELWIEMRDCLKCIRSYSHDLFVTLSNDASGLQEEITRLFPSAKVEVVENRGYDVAPFVHVLNQVNLGAYHYIVKIHTKRNKNEEATINGFSVSGNRWRKLLLRFLENEKSFQKCIDGFEKHKSVGMICDFRLIMSVSADNGKLRALVGDWAGKMGVRLNGGERFVAGTMFIARANLFEQFKRLNLRMSDFESGRVDHLMGVAHVMERILGVLVYSQACTITDCFTPVWVQLSLTKGPFFAKKIWAFIYKDKVTKSGRRIIKIFKLPVYTSIP